MNEFDHNWDRLVRQARRAGTADGPLTPPPGFVTRVLADSRSEAKTSDPIWEFAAIRSLVAAGVLAAVCLLAMWPVYRDSSGDDDLVELADPLSEVALLE
jgi:hypothetical protein